MVQIFIDKATDKSKRTDPVCFVNGNRILEPKTENVVKCHTNLIQSGRKVLFSANQSDEGVYWTECLSVVDSNGDFLVKVVNLNEKAISLENGMRIG